MRVDKTSSSPGSLNRDLSIAGAGKIHFAIESVVRQDVFEIFLLVGRIHAEEVGIVSYLVDQNVVDETAVFVEQAGVVGLADGKTRGGVGGDVIHQFQRFGTADFDLAHVADIEQPNRVAHGVVFIHDAGVLDRHVPAAEIDHAGRAGTMNFVERSAAQRQGFGHGLGYRNQCSVGSVSARRDGARGAFIAATRWWFSPFVYSRRGRQPCSQNRGPQRQGPQDRQFLRISGNCTNEPFSDIVVMPSGTSGSSMHRQKRMPWLWRAHCALRATVKRVVWRNRSSRPAVPLTKIQADVLGLLASHRDPESYVAGATPLNRDAQRYSGDIDVFHDREERVSSAAREDARALEAAGYGIRWFRQQPAIHGAVVTKDSAETRLEWVADSDFRFFPTMRDGLFGYILHPADLAMNKVMAAAGRREVRDIVDVVTIQDHTILPLGAVIWAAFEKSPGFTPEGLIAEIRRNSHYPLAEWRQLEATEPLDPESITRRLGAALDEAESFVVRMPTEKLGLLFLKDGQVVQPDPARLQDYQTHAGQRRGQWPSSAGISGAMVERYEKLSPP